MKQVLKNIKVSEIPALIAQLGFSPEQEVNLTIEENSESLISIMDKVGKKAQAKGLTEDKLTELLVGGAVRVYLNGKDVSSGLANSVGR